ISPTSRVKRVIEIALDEGRGMGDHHVGTEHLLVALMIEGDGIAAHVLTDLGADLEKVRAEVKRLRAAGSQGSAAGGAEPAPLGFRVGGRVLVHDPDPPYRLWEAKVTEDLGQGRCKVGLESHPGCAVRAHGPWNGGAARHAAVFGDLLPERKNAELLKPVYEFADGRARASGAEVTRTYIFESDQVAQAVTTELGFSPDRRERYWELDLKANASRLGDLAGQSRARMREQGLKLLTF